MKRLLKFILLFSLLVPLWASGQTRSFDRTWLGLFGKHKISDSYFIWNEFQPRLDNDRFNNQQLLIRPGVLKALGPDYEIGILYGYILTDNVKENRPTLQLTYILGKSDSATISLRNRIEFRKREDREATSVRYRGALRIQYPFSTSKSLIIWDEPFLNVTHEDWTGNRIFERNRAFIGAGINFNSFRIEVGYMNQYTPRSSLSMVDHIITLYFFY